MDLVYHQIKLWILERVPYYIQENRNFIIVWFWLFSFVCGLLKIIYYIEDKENLL